MFCFNIIEITLGSFQSIYFWKEVNTELRQSILSVELCFLSFFTFMTRVALFLNLFIASQFCCWSWCRTRCMWFVFNELQWRLKHKFSSQFGGSACQRQLFSIWTTNNKTTLTKPMSLKPRCFKCIFIYFNITLIIEIHDCRLICFI